MTDMRIVGLTLAGSLVASVATAAAPAPALPAGAVVAFTPQTVCESLPGGWAEYKDAEGRVIVGMATGLPSASAPPAVGAPDYWTKGVALKPEMIPRTPVTGNGQVVVTTPEVTVKAEALAGAKAAFWAAGGSLHLFGYQASPHRESGSEALAVGYGSAGVAGRDLPDPVPVAPPFVALRYCVKT